MTLDLTKPALLGLLFLWQIPPTASFPPGSHFAYQRRVKLSSSASASSQACAILDANVFAHAASSLKDLRLYSGNQEIPYATTLSEPLQQESEDARILNLRDQSGHILFDLEMPHRPYTILSLNLAAHDYIAKVLVSGSTAENGRDITQLGTFTVFDLSNQHLSHVTEIPLVESNFPYLHLDLTFIRAPGSAPGSPTLNLPAIIKSVTVPPSREAQSLYTTTQRATVTQQGPQGVARFNVPSRVPIERIAFTLPSSSKGSFSRVVKIEARGIRDEASAPHEDSSESTTAPLGIESAAGTILRVHKSESGRELSAESLSIPVSIGSNMQQPAIVEVRIEDGTGAPMPFTVELQMRQRSLCFDARSASAPLVLFYGNASLDAPAYTEAALKQAVTHPGLAELGPETENPAFAAPAPSRGSFTRHRPILRWIALLGCVCIFALLVIRRSHRARH